MVIKKYYNEIIKTDFINRYYYLKFKEIPKLEKIILNFGCKNSNFYSISAASLFLELISQKKSIVTKSKRSNILFKIKKGNLVGCMVILRKDLMYQFLHRLVVYIFPNFKDFEGIRVLKKNLFKKKFCFTIRNFSCFKELDKQFYLFPELPYLNITLISNSRTKKEMLYLLQSLKLPLVVI